MPAARGDADGQLAADRMTWMRWSQVPDARKTEIVSLAAFTA